MVSVEERELLQPLFATNLESIKDSLGSCKVINYVLNGKVPRFPKDFEDVERSLDILKPKEDWISSGIFSNNTYDHFLYDTSPELFKDRMRDNIGHVHRTIITDKELRLLQPLFETDLISIKDSLDGCKVIDFILNGKIPRYPKDNVDVDYSISKLRPKERQMFLPWRSDRCYEDKEFFKNKCSELLRHKENIADQLSKHVNYVVNEADCIDTPLGPKGPKGPPAASREVDFLENIFGKAHMMLPWACYDNKNDGIVLAGEGAADMYFSPTDNDIRILQFHIIQTDVHDIDVYSNILQQYLNAVKYVNGSIEHNTTYCFMSGDNLVIRIQGRKITSDDAYLMLSLKSVKALSTIFKDIPIDPHAIVYDGKEFHLDYRCKRCIANKWILVDPLYRCASYNKWQMVAQPYNKEIAQCALKYNMRILFPGYQHMVKVQDQLKVQNMPYFVGQTEHNIDLVTLPSWVLLKSPSICGLLSNVMMSWLAEPSHPRSLRTIDHEKVFDNSYSIRGRSHNYCSSLLTRIENIKRRVELPVHVGSDFYIDYWSFVDIKSEFTKFVGVESNGIRIRALSHFRDCDAIANLRNGDMTSKLNRFIEAAKGAKA